MRRIFVWTPVFLALLNLACGSTTQEPVSKPPLNTASAEPARTAPGKVAPPANAQWTIFCTSLSGPAHVADARRLKEQLIANTELKNWHIVHGEAESALYYGYYSSANDSTNQADLQRIKAITSGSNRPFAEATLVKLNSSDPPAPSEWDVVNSGMHWSLQIGVYLDSPDRKQAAVEAVREARAQGVQAYYYHGDRASSVLIGAWPENAVRLAKPQENADRNKNVVFSTVRLPPELQKRLAQDKNTVAVTPDLEVLDPGMIEAMKKYPDHYINGEVFVSRTRDPQSKRMVETRDKSFLIVIPSKASQSALTTGLEDDMTGMPSQMPSGSNADIYGTTPEAPGNKTGKLRGIGE